MAGLLVPQMEFTQYTNHTHAASTPVVTTIPSKSEHATPEDAESALLSRYTFQQSNSPYASNDSQTAIANEDGSLVMIRRILKANSARARAIRTEIDFLWEIPHPIIPTIYEWLETPETLYLIQDHKPRRSLRQLIEVIGPVPPDGVKDVMTQLFSGIAHLFLHHIAPMRLTPENLLFDRASNLVIGDFDHAVKYSEEKVVGQPYALVTGTFGEDIYTAPEVFEDGTYNARKAVVWNCGVVLYYMVTGQTTRLSDLSHPSTINQGLPIKRRYSVATKLSKDIPKIINYPNRLKVPAWALNIISRMLLFDPAKRPELIEVAAKVPKMAGVHGQRPLMEVAYLDYKYNVGPVGVPVEQLLYEGSGSSIFGGASSVFSGTGLLGRRGSWR